VEAEAEGRQRGRKMLWMASTALDRGRRAFTALDGGGRRASTALDGFHRSGSRQEGFHCSGWRQEGYWQLNSKNYISKTPIINK
jgi:hypothetical protein